MDIKALISNGYNYTHGNIDFGEEGKLVTPDQNNIIKWFFTYRDGIFVQIKQLSPYRIVFEFSDGSSIINTTDGKMQDFLNRFRDDLDNFQNEINRKVCKDEYHELEKIVFIRAEELVSLL